MLRREFLWTAPVVGLAGGCAMPGRADMVPWLLWGDKETVKVSTAPGSFQTARPFQLSKIQYGRPDTWKFFLGAQVVKPPAPNLATQVLVDIDFDIMIGVGRSRFDTNYERTTNFQHFVTFSYVYAGGASPRDLGPRYATEVLAPPISTAVPGVRQLIREFPAESIQCSGQVRVTTFEVVDIAVEMTAFFSPQTHIRPDWYQVDGTPFAGGETGGR